MGWRAPQVGSNHAVSAGQKNAARAWGASIFQAPDWQRIAVAWEGHDIRRGCETGELNGNRLP